MRQLLKAHENVEKAMVARKKLKYFASQRLYVMCIQVHTAWHRIPTSEQEQSTVSKLFKAVKLPGRVLVFAPRGQYRSIARKLRALPDSMVYQRQ